MSLAFLFAGQGSQEVGMGNALKESCPDCRATFQEADDALGFPLSEMISRGRPEVLRRTANAQPAILTLSVAHARHLRSLGLEPDWMAGHSLGQYSALVIAGALDFASAVRLVQRRGQLMQSAVRVDRVGMMAIVGIERECVEEACSAVRAKGVADVACHNAPEQTVISGDLDALEAVAEICEEQGGSAVPLAVSAPFHSKLLEPIVSKFASLVFETRFSDPAIPVIDNVTARSLANAQAVRHSLIAQVTAPVLFEESLRYLVEHRVERFIQCGPGKNLLSFARRIAPDSERLTFEEAAPVASPVQ